MIIGRLVPIIRTFVPIVAGMVEMKWRQYLLFNAVGAFLWGGVLTYMGYLMGRLIPNPERYLYPVVFIIIVLSILPVLYKLMSMYFKRERQ